MKKNIALVVVVMLFMSSASFAQKAKAPSACKMYLEGKVVEEISVEDALKWCDLTPPTIKCDDGKVYFLQTFMVNFFTMKPLQNKDFGIGEGGIPIMARNAIAKGMSGDAIVLKEVSAVDSEGNKVAFQVISLKLK
jgi:hypothetical protein